METTRQQILELERAEALPYVVFPPTPRWWALVMGVYFGGLIAAFALWSGQPALFAGVVVLLVLGWAVAFGAVRAKYGAWPKVGRQAPAEIRSEYRRYWTGLVVVAVAVAVVWWLAGTVAAGVTAFVLVTVGVALYEARYAAAAAVVRERLGIAAHAEGGASA